MVILGSRRTGLVDAGVVFRMQCKPAEERDERGEEQELFEKGRNGGMKLERRTTEPARQVIRSDRRTAGRYLTALNLRRHPPADNRQEWLDETARRA